MKYESCMRLLDINDKGGAIDFHYHSQQDYTLIYYYETDFYWIISKRDVDTYYKTILLKKIISKLLFIISLPGIKPRKLETKNQNSKHYINKHLAVGALVRILTSWF